MSTTNDKNQPSNSNDDSKNNNAIDNDKMSTSPDKPTRQDMSDELLSQTQSNKTSIPPSKRSINTSSDETESHKPATGNLKNTDDDSRPGSLKSLMFGSGLSDNLQRETAILSNSSPIRKRSIDRDDQDLGTTTLKGQREVILVIRGMIERVVMVEDTKYKVGRFELGTKSFNEIDLTPYGALDRGVSRIHAEFHVEGDSLYITDLGSTNGTFVSSKQLTPNHAQVLRKGDELLLGRLPVQVLFR